MSSTGFSRRQFILSSVATGIAGVISRPALSAVAASPSTDSQNQLLTFEVIGDRDRGYGVDILFKRDRVARHNAGGEFSAVFQNTDRSREDRIESWKASSWKGDHRHLYLQGEFQLPNLNTTVGVQVEYEAVNGNVARKRIRFHQADSYVLLYQLTNSLESLDAPARFWSFDQLDCGGGALHEYFPAAGFRTPSGVAVGLLTDAGYRNNWSRIIRRDGKPLKSAPWEIPDVRLYSARRSEERSNGTFSIQQTFGEALVRLSHQDSETHVPLPPSHQWQKRGDARLEENNGATVLSLDSSEAGVVIPFAATDVEIYGVRFRYRAKQAFSVQVWDVDERLNQLANTSLYNDRIPESPTEWAEFRTEVFFYSRRGSGGALSVSLPESEQANRTTPSPAAVRIELQDLEICQISTHLQPYHRLEMDHPGQSTSFIFVDDRTLDTLRGYRLASQQYLADGLGFKGGETEKVLYADLMMLSWAASPDYLKPMVAPSIWYSAAGEMYLRDSFFALNGIHNRKLNEGVFELWGANQGSDGAINTLVEPSIANLERKANDSTPLWLMWALRNRARFGSTLAMDKVHRAAEYFLRTYDRHHNGTCWAQFVMGQLDVIDYPEGTTDICENQGMFAVTLRVIKELRIAGVSNRISDDYIEKAEAAYRSYYDSERNIVCPARQVTDAIGFGEIFPEFLSLWLFGRKILTNEMVVNHLDRIPVLLPNKDCPCPEARVARCGPFSLGCNRTGAGAMLPTNGTQ